MILCLGTCVTILRRSLVDTGPKATMCQTCPKTLKIIKLLFCPSTPQTPSRAPSSHHVLRGTDVAGRLPPVDSSLSLLHTMMSTIVHRRAVRWKLGAKVATLLTNTDRAPSPFSFVGTSSAVVMATGTTVVLRRVERRRLRPPSWPRSPPVPLSPLFGRHLLEKILADWGPKCRRPHHR